MYEDFFRHILLEFLRSEQQLNRMCDRILDPYLVRRPLVVNVRNELRLPTSDRLPLCFVEDARPRSNMLVCFLVNLFFLQSYHSTEFCRGTFVHPCGISAKFLMNSGFTISLEQ